MKLLKCPHCGKINEVLSYATLRAVIEWSYTKPERLKNRRCSKCNKYFDAIVIGSDIETLPSNNG